VGSCGSVQDPVVALTECEMHVTICVGTYKHVYSLKACDDGV
jgi:hypothetical protein